MDNLIQEKIRDWQKRRLDIKTQMQEQPERILELSRVLDLMDEEHAAILSSAPGRKSEANLQQSMPHDSVLGTQPSIHAVAQGLDLRLHVTAGSPENLLRLLEMAVYELQGQINAGGVRKSRESGGYPGRMSGTLGSYDFELRMGEDASHE